MTVIHVHLNASGNTNTGVTFFAQRVDMSNAIAAKAVRVNFPKIRLHRATRGVFCVSSGGRGLHFRALACRVFDAGPPIDFQVTIHSDANVPTDERFSISAATN